MVGQRFVGFLDFVIEQEFEFRHLGTEFRQVDAAGQKFGDHADI